jgi:pimeloyl-ACP methyl ester carboxylesterase
VPTIRLDGELVHTFAHPVAGSRLPPLLLIHGAAGQYAVWPPPMRRLKGISTYAPDLPGHGRSTGKGRRSIAAYAADILALLDALDLERVVVAGHSMGGGIAQQLALDAPGRVAGLVLVATGARLRVAPQILDNVLNDFDSVVDLVTAYSFGPTASPDLKRLGRELMADAAPQVVHADFLACDAFDVRSRLAGIGAPTLVVGGTADRMTPAEFARFLADEIPGAELHLVEDGGHMVMSEFPARMARIVAGWLENKRPAIGR